jgi:hypothetical protein
MKEVIQMDILMHRPKCLEDQKVEKKKYKWHELPEVFQRVLEKQKERKNKTPISAN